MRTLIATLAVSTMFVPVTAAIQAQRPAALKTLTLPADHAFADHRIALAATTVSWRDAQWRPAQTRPAKRQ